MTRKYEEASKLGDRLTSHIYPSGLQVSYGFDGDGRADSVSYQEGAYDALGVWTGIGTPTALISEAKYSVFSPVTRITFAQTGSPYQVHGLDGDYNSLAIISPQFTNYFKRDAMGHILAEGATSSISPVTESYKYDPLFRLTELDNAQGSAEQRFTYNATGDRLTKTIGSQAPVTYSYNAGTHQLASVGGLPRKYDAAGNTTAMTAPNGLLIGLGYDDRGLLTTVTNGTAVIASYQYDGFGTRVSRTVTSPAMQEATIYDPTGTGALFGEYTSTSHREYVYLGGIPVAMISDTSPDSGAIVTDLYTDQYGTVRATTDSSGNLISKWPWENNAFGDQMLTGYDSVSQRFPGQTYDAETGLHYNINRYYDPASGRYIQSDPIGLGGGASTYAYVGGDPLDYIDPLGLDGIAPDYYRTFIPLCSGTCTPQQAFEAMRHFSAPSAPYAATGTHDLMLWGGNPIRQTVDPCHLTITNVTLPGHVFRGQVQITITSENGTLGADVVGSGSGPNAALNQEVGPAIFQAMGYGAYMWLNPSSSPGSFGPM